MQATYVGMLGDTDKLNIKDTRELTGKKLLSFFMTIFNTFSDSVNKKPVVQEYFEVVKKASILGLDYDFEWFLDIFPGLVIDSFVEFLHDCPNVHVTID